jgi:hypothetical protein
MKQATFIPHPLPNPPLEGEGENLLLPLQGGGWEGDGAVFHANLTCLDAA